VEFEQMTFSLQSSIVMLALSLLLAWSPAATAQGDLPTAEALFEAHVDGIGGREAIEAQRNRVVYGSIDFDGEGTQILIIYQQAPNLMRYTAESPGQFTITRGFDGENPWGIGPNGLPVTVAEGSDEARDLRFNAVFAGDAAYKTQYSSMRTNERTLFDNKPVFAVDVQTFSGLSQRIFFDVESKLIIGKTQVVQGSEGTPTELLFIYDEYTDYEGVKLVSKQRQVLGGKINTIATHFVEVNVDELPSFSAPSGAEASASVPVSPGG
jgi:hypothetical protein